MADFHMLRVFKFVDVGVVDHSTIYIIIRLTSDWQWYAE